MLPWELLW